MLSQFFMPLFLFILALKNLNTMLYSCFNNNPIFARRIFCFRCNAVIALLMSGSQAINLVLKWKFFLSSLFLYSHTKID